MITLTLNTLDPAVGDDGDMAKKPRTDRPRRRSFSPAEKPRLLAGYETATESGTGNTFLGENGLYSSLISEWRRTRDAGLLTVSRPGRWWAAHRLTRRRSPGCAASSTSRNVGWSGLKQL